MTPAEVDSDCRRSRLPLERVNKDMYRAMAARKHSAAPFGDYS